MRFYLIAVGAFVGLTLSLAAASPVLNGKSEEESQLLHKLYEGKDLRIMEVREAIERLVEIYDNEGKEVTQDEERQLRKRLFKCLNRLSYNSVKCTENFFSGVHLLMNDFTSKMSPKVHDYVKEAYDMQLRFCRTVMSFDFKPMDSQSHSKDLALTMLEKEFEL